MGVKPTRPNFKAFSFDGTSSRNYGVYITGQGVFNAPERNVEMVEIPGRDGAYALDKGNFNNIEVTYPASIVADTSADFADAVSDLRNFLCSKVGYCRLEDEYNPNEYRMAIYKSGLEVSHEGLQTGEFDIVFECKPQRWLTSGESKQTLTSGNAITNPTLFPSRPQLQVYGYGDIAIGNDGTITVANTTLGSILIPNDNGTLDLSNMNTGDSFTVSGANAVITYQADRYEIMSNASITSASNCSAVVSTPAWTREAIYTAVLDDYTFTKGTSGSRASTLVLSFTVHSTTTSVTATITLAYDGSSTISITTSLSPATVSYTTVTTSHSYDDIFGESTKTALGSPTYIDLDIGEAYFISGGSAVSANNAVNIPAELPTLPSGATTITFDNTFTKVDIVPRWWKV